MRRSESGGGARGTRLEWCKCISFMTSTAVCIVLLTVFVCSSSICSLLSSLFQPLPPYFSLPPSLLLFCSLPPSFFLTLPSLPPFLTFHQAIQLLSFATFLYFLLYLPFYLCAFLLHLPSIQCSIIYMHPIYPPPLSFSVLSLLLFANLLFYSSLLSLPSFSPSLPPSYPPSLPPFSLLFFSAADSPGLSGDNTSSQVPKSAPHGKYSTLFNRFIL